MTTLQYRCPFCKKTSTVKLWNNKTFNCTNCNESLNVDTLDSGTTAKIIGNPFDSIQRNSIETSSHNNNDDSWTTFTLILGFLIGASYGLWKWYDETPTRVTKAQTSLNFPITPANSEPKLALKENNTSNEHTQVPKKNLIYFHIINTYQKTNKTIRCTGKIDEANKSMILTAIDRPSDSFIILAGQQGISTFQYYINNQLEVEKAVYRRSDLEKKDGTLVYTSRTGEITLSVSY